MCLSGFAIHIQRADSRAWNKREAWPGSYIQYGRPYLQPCLRGVKDPVLSGDLLSGGAYVFYRHIAPLIQAVSLLFQAIDPDVHLHYLQQYRYVQIF